MIEYVVTVKNTVTYGVPFTFRLMITTRPNYETYEYSCNAGE